MIQNTKINGCNMPLTNASLVHVCYLQSEVIALHAAGARVHSLDSGAASLSAYHWMLKASTFMSSSFVSM